MPANTVNLDALIPREDFSLTAEDAGGQPRSGIAISDLDAGFFSTSLRKPDFQRETTSWTPQKVVDLVQAYVTGDLIPAIILWQRGSDIFVIDGAHRLSALMAWIKDDYGQGLTSLDYFGGRIPQEQEKIANQIRALVNKTVGSYASYVAGAKNQANLTPEMQKRISMLGGNSMVVQWVRATDPQVAEASFFKINQAAQPIDPTERRILEARSSPNAIGARAIVRAGAGHAYWGKFSEAARLEIEALGKEMWDMLYSPPLGDNPIKTLDIPVAGRGYNTLPFVFDLVNLTNEVPMPANPTSKKLAEPPVRDEDGQRTIEFLKAARNHVSRITGTAPESLGLHPAIYFYGRSGQFQPVTFLSAIEFVGQLVKDKKLRQFQKVRAEMEEFLFANKVFNSLTVTRLGAGSRSLFRITEMYRTIMDLLLEGKSTFDVEQHLFGTQDFGHLAMAKHATPRAADKKAGGDAGSASKSAAFFRDAMSGAAKCHICRAAVHRNSLSFDHEVARRDGGSGDMQNLKLAHPYCNSSKG